MNREQCKFEPLCRYCDRPAVACRTEGSRESRTFRCENHRDTEDADPGIDVRPRPTYSDMPMDSLMAAMRRAWRKRCT